MSDLPIRRLGELILIKKGKKPASFATNRRNEADRPYLLIESFGGNYKSFTDDSSCPYSSKEDTLLVWDGERCGLTSTGHEGYIGSTLASIRRSTGDLEPSYLYHFLASKRKAIRNSAEGTGVPHVSRRFLEDIEILLPPLPEQKRIAEVLSRNKKLTLTLKGKLFLLRNLLTAIRNDLFIRHEHNGDLDKRPISDLINSGDLVLIQDGNHGEKHPKASQFISNGIPFVMASHIKEGRFNPDPGKCLSPEIVSGLRIGHSTTGDVLLTHKATIGETCIVPDHCNEIMLSPQVTMYRLDKHSAMTPEFLREWFMTTAFQTEISEMSGQSTRDYIGIKAQQQLHAMVPSNRSIADSITQSISPISDAIKLISENLIAQDKLRSALTSDLLSGRKRGSI